PNPPDTALATLATLQCGVAQVLPIGSNVSVTSALVPAVNSAIYYLVGHRNTSGPKTVLGRGANNAVEIYPISCPYSAERREHRGGPSGPPLFVQGRVRAAW